MTREELIDLGKKIVSAEGTEKELEEWMAVFDKHVPHPAGSNLFFYPEDENSEPQSEYDPTVEEVVDICLAYKPIQL